MAEKSMRPRIRFKGFTDAWEQRKLGDITYYATSSLKISDCVYEGKFDLYDANAVIGKTNFNVQVEDYITIIKDGSGVGTVRLLPKNTSFIGTMGALLAKNKEIEFLYALLQSFDFSQHINGATIPHIYYSEYKQDIICVPSCNEQARIGEFFKQLDNLITLHQRKYDKIVNIKKALLEKMFPSDAETTPKIRSKGFTDAWEQRKLGEVANIQKGQQLGRAEMSVVGTFYVLNGGIEPSGYTDQCNTPANTISISEGGNSCGYVSLNLEQFWSGGHNYTLQNPNIDTVFLYQWLKRHEKVIMSLRVGSGLPNIQKSSLKDVDVLYPANAEQLVIAKFLIKLDNLITLHQRQLEKLKNIKSALLEKMFV